MASSASDRKISEGLEHLRQAEKCMKTGFLKWKPDLDGAVSEYSKAAVCFKNAKAHEQATSSYLKCSDVQRQMGSPFHAAKSLESAALIYKDLKEFDRAADLIQKASDLYLEHGTPDTAALALDRAAKMMETEKPQRAIQLYKKACDVSEAEDRPRQCAEMLGKAGRVLIRTKRLEEAADVLKRELEYYNQCESHGVVNKLVMGLVLVQLHRADYVAADQAHQAALRYPGFAESEEAAPIGDLLQAYEEADQETADEILHSPLFRYMENDFTKLARDLRIPGATKKVKDSSTEGGGQGAPPPGTGVHEGEDDEDDYAGGLL